MTKVLDETAALLRHLRMSRGRFSLAFVNWHNIGEESLALARLRQESPTLIHQSIDVSTVQPVELMSTLQSIEAGDVLHLFGLDRHLTQTPVGTSPHEILRVLNLQRELWRTQVSRPVVIWLPEDALHVIASGAPDFWSWRSGIFEIPPPRQTTHRADEPSFRADISRIVKYAPAELIGREVELRTLSDAWQQAVNAEKKRPHILTFVALGGEGKTSLVAKWAAELAYQGWPGCDAAFAWSFYSQGTSEKTQASSDIFLAEALRFFGDEETAGSAKGGYEKGKRLAQLVGEKRVLLILDGVEPLQYPPGPPMDGILKDDGIAALVKPLATLNVGLCIVTTRYSITDLKAFGQTTAPEIKLASLSREAGVHLLKMLGVKGTQQEFETLVADVKGHALTLNLLGTYLRDAHGGDIRKRDLVKLQQADAEEQSGHAFHVLDAYVASFKSKGENGRRALSILRLLGLFDRPATADSLNVLWTEPEIAGLTGPLIGTSDAQRNITLKWLEDANLITVNREEDSGALISLDAHPLLREYFANRVRQQFPGAWRAANRRLYEYLRDRTKDKPSPTLEDLQPLYQAVAHGCQAGEYQQALDEVYRERILRGSEYYPVRRLGAFGSDLEAISCFFERPWSRVAANIRQNEQAWLLGNAAVYLRSLGRLNEATEPVSAGLHAYVEQRNVRAAAITASNLSELESVLGDLSLAIEYAAQSVTYADRSGDPFQRMGKRTTHGDAMNQAGRIAEAQTRFREAEQIQIEYQPDYPLLYSIGGFRYCDLLLAAPESAAWREMQESEVRSHKSELIDLCRAVSQRAAQTLNWATQAAQDILSVALDHLTLGRAALYEAILAGVGIDNRNLEIENAVDGLRRAGAQHMIPLGLLTRAWLRFLTGVRTGRESAQEDLDEAWEIAERGPMRLHMADIHLYRARLFHDVKPYPWKKFADGSEGRGAKDDLDAAEKLINDCGYHRRDEELADAREAAKNWT